MDRDELIAVVASEGSSHGPSISRLPVELCERILDHLAMEWDLRFADPKGEPRMTTLACCSLVCRTWYYLTWYHLRQCIHLRDRKDVLLLSKTLRERPRLREVVQQIIIYQSIQHLGTFAAMLVGKIPNLSMITIRDLEWTIGSVRIEDFSYLAAFCSVTTLHVYNITLSSVAPLAHLIAAFPRLRQLWCINVICSQTQASPVSLPLNFANLLVIDVRWVAPAVEDLFVRISQASRARALVLGVADETHPSPATSRSQTLLDATSASVEVAVLHIDISSPAHDVTIDAIVAQHYNLLRHESLRGLDISLYYPCTALTWIPHILSHITSKNFEVMSVVLALRADQTAQDLGEMLTKMEEDGVLTQLDKILQEKHLSGTVALRGVCLGFDDDGVAWRFGKTPVGTVSTLGEQYDRWDELVRRKMPHSNRRGLLTTVHNAHEHIIWRRKMKRYDIKAVEQKNVTGEEVQGQDDETHQGGMD